MKPFLPRLVACLFVVVSSSSHAALYDRGNGLIYDDVLDITWMQDANYAQTSGYDLDGRMTWADANTWADQLSYGGFDDWRLASAGNAPAYAYTATGELGHMFYNNLGNTAYTSILNNVSFTDATPGGGTESFLNVQSSVYWYGEENPSSSNFAPAFYTYDGRQVNGYKGGRHYSWAVHDGDIGASPVPLPAAFWLFASGLISLRLFKR